jgi:hypothetical protein
MKKNNTFIALTVISPFLFISCGDKNDDISDQTKELIEKPMPASGKEIIVQSTNIMNSFSEKISTIEGIDSANTLSADLTALSSKLNSLRQEGANMGQEAFTLEAMHHPEFLKASEKYNSALSKLSKDHPRAHALIKSIIRTKPN